MIQAHFTSTSPVPLYQLVLDTLDHAQDLAKRGPVEVRMMVFSFTLEAVYNKIISLANQPNISVKILGDWGNISTHNHRKLSQLAKLRHPRITVKYKFDIPYFWDHERDRLQWSYHNSVGMMHHKIVLVSQSGQAKRLLSGSYNFTKKATDNYENVLILDRESAEVGCALEAFKREFDAFWNHPELSLNYSQAQMHFARIKQFYSIDKTRTNEQLKAAFVSRLNNLEDERLRPEDRPTSEDSIQLAFSASHPFKEWRNFGYDAQNTWRYFLMTKEAGEQKRVPLSLGTVALDLIFSADKDSELCLCMYALSPRVAEYGALLNAARRGTRLRIILDKEANEFVIGSLFEVVENENLPIKIKAGKRGMHEKYLLDSVKNNLVTGTANMSTDASSRHCEHRFLFKSQPEIVRQYLADFNTIWERIPFWTADKNK